MKVYLAYQANVQLTDGLIDPDKAKLLEKKMGSSYQRAIGELIYALTIYRINMSSVDITLSQYACLPTQIHYEAVKSNFLYLNAIKHDGLTYWREALQPKLPSVPHPDTITNPDLHTRFP